MAADLAFIGVFGVCRYLESRRYFECTGSVEIVETPTGGNLSAFLFATLSIQGIERE